MAVVAVVVDAAALFVVLVVDPLLALLGVLVRLRGVAVVFLSSVRSFDSGLPSSSSCRKPQVSLKTWRLYPDQQRPVQLFSTCFGLVLRN